MYASVTCHSTPLGSQSLTDMIRKCVDAYGEIGRVNRPFTIAPTLTYLFPCFCAFYLFVRFKIVISAHHHLLQTNDFVTTILRHKFNVTIISSQSIICRTKVLHDIQQCWPTLRGGRGVTAWRKECLCTFIAL